MLYFVPTPIGNLEDMTYRAVSVLSSCDKIYCEDTRHSSILLRHYALEKPTASLHAHSSDRVYQTILEQLRSGKNIAVISDAGTPGISDPAFNLVRLLIDAGLEYTVLPGSSAVVPAVVAAGLGADRFYFQWFLPLKKGRQKTYAWLAEVAQKASVVLYESPFRVKKTVSEILQLGGMRVRVCRELSKLHEEYRDVTPDTIETLKEKGEYVIVFRAQKEEQEEPEASFF